MKKLAILILSTMMVAGSMRATDNPEEVGYLNPIYINIHRIFLSPSIDGQAAVPGIMDTYDFERMNPYRYEILLWATKYDHDPYLIAAMIWQESRARRFAVGGVGEAGLMQLRPEYHMSGLTRKQWFMPYHNIMRGSRYLRACINDKGSVWQGVSCYNTGQSAGFINWRYVNAVKRHYIRLKY